MVLANELVKLLEEKNMTIAMAESVTAGLASAKLAVYKGVADVLKGSVVCYTPEVKNSLLKVSQKLIDEFTCESQEVTDELAERLPSLISADIHVAVTGLACEGGSETKEKPVGTIFISVLIDGKLKKKRVLLKGTPSEIREAACDEIFEFVTGILKKTKSI